MGGVSNAELRMAASSLYEGERKLRTEERRAPHGAQGVQSPTGPHSAGASAGQASPQSPFMAQSRHAQCADECPLLGVKRTSLNPSPMSANDPKRTSRCFQNSQGSHLVIIRIWKCRDPESVRLTTGANDDRSKFFPPTLGRVQGHSIIKGLKWY